MSKDYIKPQFNKLIPTRIDVAINRVRKSPLYNADILVSNVPSEEKFKLAYEKFSKAPERLTTKEYKVLCYYVDKIESYGTLKKFLNEFDSRINNFLAYRGFPRPLLAFIYNNYDSSISIDKIYLSLSKVVKKLDKKEKFKTLNNKINQNSEVKNYLYSVKYDFGKLNTMREIEDTLKKYLLRKTDEFYLECIISFIVKNHRKNEMYGEYEKIVKTMKLNLKTQVFKEILEQYLHNDDLDSYPDLWFDLMTKQLGDPYSSANTKWNGISEECKEVYRRWNNNKYIYNFFSSTVVGGDQERLEFWKKYIDSIYRIRYFKDANDALVMEFKNHVFAEFAQKGNALYIYDKKVFSIDHIEKMASRRHISAAALKDKYIVQKRMNHAGYWQFSFETYIEDLGYKPGRW